MNDFADLKITQYEMQARVLAPLVLPEYTGSTLHGAFGAALRRLSCLTGMPQCQACSLRFSCAYSYCYETPVAVDSPLMRKYPSAPHPWLIDVDIGSGVWDVGDLFTFSWTLFGQAQKYAPQMLYTWKKALQEGLGKNRSALELIGIRHAGETVWQTPDRIPEGGTILPPMPTNPGRLHLRFETPLRIQRNGQILGAEQLRFVDLLSALQRRLGLLCTFHETASASEWDYKAALAMAEATPWHSIAASWWDWSRYSARQKQWMSWGGILGEYAIDALPDPLWPLIYQGQWTHVGKSAAFGLGRYRILPW